MKSVLQYMAAGMLAISFAACSHEDLPEVPGIKPGKVTAVGQPDGDGKIEKEIGPEGGTLASKDGKLIISIPAGTLLSKQMIGIERITNECPLGINKAYRLTPENVVLANPVTVTFPYTDADVANTVPEALGIAYQAKSGVWNAINTTTLDKPRKKVFAKLKEFRDLDFFKTFILMSSASGLPVNGTAQLSVISTADDIVGLPGMETPIPEPEYMTETYVKSWNLAGQGTLTPNKGKATYKAPAQVPATQNPVTISANIDLKQKGQYMVVTQISILGDDEIQIRVNGGAWQKRKAGPAIRYKDGYYGIADIDGSQFKSYILVRWTGGIGTHAFKTRDQAEGTYAHYQFETGNEYVPYYMKDYIYYTSGGGVNITSMGEQDGYISGTFSIVPAGYGETLEQTATVEGSFKVRKSW